MRKDLTGTRLYIATPTHGGGMKPEHVESLTRLLIYAPQRRVMCHYDYIKGSVLHNMRNKLVAGFMASQDENKLLIGEDYMFCDRWTDIGGKIFVDDTAITGHVGTKTYRGQLREFVDTVQKNPERFPQYFPNKRLATQAHQ